MWLGVFCGLLAGAMWGMVFIAPKLLPGFSPWELAFGRYLAYGLIALAVMAPRLRQLFGKLVAADYIALARQAMTGNIVYYILLAYGVKLAGVGPTSLIIGVLPISVTLLGRHLHRQEQLGQPRQPEQQQNGSDAISLRKLLLPLLLVAAGIACINIDLFSEPVAGAHSRGEQALGVLFAAGALACWTWYAVDNARYLKQNPHFTSNQWSALYGLASGLIAALIAMAVAAGMAFGGGSGETMGAAMTTGAAMLPDRNWAYFWGISATLALGASMIGNNLWNMASRLVPITLSGQLIVFETLFALLYGFIYDNRMPRMLEIAAMILLIWGVAWAVRAHAEPAHAA